MYNTIFVSEENKMIGFNAVNRIGEAKLNMKNGIYTVEANENYFAGKFMFEKKVAELRGVESEGLNEEDNLIIDAIYSYYFVNYELMDYIKFEIDIDLLEPHIRSMGLDIEKTINKLNSIDVLFKDMSEIIMLETLSIGRFSCESMLVARSTSNLIYIILYEVYATLMDYSMDLMDVLEIS